MADPLSIAGLVTGVISLGLQVAGGLTNYLDAVKGRSEDLRSAKQGATEMKDLLLTIQDLLPQVESNWPESAITVKRHVNSCHVELGALHAFLSELSQQSPSGSDLRSRFENAKKKLSYPFERSQISRLEDRLAKVNSTLQTALQVTGLNVAITSANQMREVRSLVVSLSQSQISLRTQSVGASVSLTTAREIPGATNRGPPLPLYSIGTAMSLASKPSLLSSSIKSFEELNAVQSPNRNLYQACLCRPSRKIAHHRQDWGHLSFLYQVSSTRRHLPDCPLSRIDSETQASKFTIEYFGLGSLFRTAFALSLVSTRGAGGRSISPGFTYYPTVDRWTAPAFKVISIVKDFIRINKDWNETAIRTVQCCYDTIFELYKRKKASPKDVTSDGESLMHIIFSHFGGGPPIIANASLQMVMNLLACGVPVTTYDENGYTPAIACLYYSSDEISSAIGLAKRLLPESNTPLVQDPTLYSNHILLLRGFWEDSELAEASGCGPLSLAARAGEEKLVQELIRKYPQSLEETDDLGYTPLHLAIQHPLCLRLILEAGASSMLEKSVDEEWGWSWTPLACACHLGYKASAQILLAAGGHVNVTCIEYSDESCLDDVLVALKQSRDGLKLLALEHLTQAEAEHFGLHEKTVLDGHAWEVQRLLLEKGIPIPPHLCEYLFPPVYFLDHPIIPFFDKLWALGFRDINSFDGSGDVPLTKHRREVEKVRWLIEHGADYWTPLNRRTGNTNASYLTATPAHFVSGNIELLYKLYYSEDSNEYAEKVDDWQWLVEKLMQVQVSDACFCPCSRGGCTPLKALFDFHRHNHHPFSIQRLAQLCVLLTRTSQASFSAKDLIIILRRMTFDGLRLTHTCCNFWVWHKSLRSSEEVDEIILEQRSLLTLFDDMLVEFDKAAHEDKDGVPLIVQDSEEFWMRRWLPRMEETLDGLDGDDLTAEERLAAEAVGVQWDVQSDQDEEEDEDQWSPEYVMKEVKRILDE
ncbi:hypothetical protein F5Y12DRAFT_712201 [Xylaria sp. FL1777]|nr:hypothetical protein F5Y12DRAFT_712201 [Xylaria sp. FL1777]